MKRGLAIIVGLGLMLASVGCIVERRDGEYPGHRDEYRENEEHRDRDYDRDHEHRDRDEQRDYDYRD